MFLVDVSVIIVNYNTKDLTINCIRSIFDHTNGINYEVIVVDNASSDGSLTEIENKFPSVITINSQENLGFGRANNLASQYSTGKYLFFLNSDCILIENAIKKMFDYFESQNNSINRIGAIGCLLLDMNRKLNTSYNRFPTPFSQIKRLFIERVNRLFNTHFKLKDRFNYQLDKNYEVDFITGADLFISKDVFTFLNGFDPSFFLYYEETDLQKRMSDNSLKRIILDDVEIIHLEGGSTSRKLSSITIFLNSEFKYMRKHYPVYVYMLYYSIMTILMLPTLFVSSHSKKDKKVFLKMLIRNCKYSIH
ncbi:MAG: hypothetical protein BGO33_04215 [Bacteroidia bacterium 43-41]|nr:MAG: hypothetical protein BGO33_04215 [Bacteroidia bacterium 43-41]